MLTIALSARFSGLADDTEESLLGSTLHQQTIVALNTGLTLCGPARGLPWFIGNQLVVIIPRDVGAPYRPSPDILVHPTLGGGLRSSLIVGSDGPPALVIEVASPGTYETDIDMEQGKAAAYEAIGVAEYLVFDPTGEYLGTQVWARHAGPRGFVPWEPDANGRWVSRALGIAFAPLSVLLRVYDQEGEMVPLITELALMLAEERRRVADREKRLAEQAVHLAAQERHLANQETRLADQDTRLTDQDARLADQDTRLTDQDTRLTALATEVRRLRAAADAPPNDPSRGMETREQHE